MIFQLHIFWLLFLIRKNLCEDTDKTNLLFIIFDDLRHQLSMYGQKYMMTPNFERLASKSIIFDNAYCQIAVCNPSRDSLLTGLRPDTVGTYSFQWSFRPHIVIPAHLSNSGFNTAGFGKVLHWEGTDTKIWNHRQFDGDWYDFQSKEINYMNSTTMPDKTRPEESFRDYMFATKTIDAIRELHKQPKRFAIGIGFKLPHLAVHIPYKYYQMYTNLQDSWRLTETESTFPKTSPAVSYRCCANDVFKYMNEEGALQAKKIIPLTQNVDFIVPEDMRNELMMGYCGAISFLDVQIGRILDVLDELSLWNNLTIILTSDHGIHNGEKGLWEKWTMFDESTRVPLLIHHPQSPHQGRHYKYPVELLDIFPTINDLLGVEYREKESCKKSSDYKCLKLQGQSLADIVLKNWRNYTNESYNTSTGMRSSGTKRKGKLSHKNNINDRIRNPQSVSVIRKLTTSDTARSSSISGSGSSSSISGTSPRHTKHLSLSEGKDFAITQSWRCAPRSDLRMVHPAAPQIYNDRANVWFDCSRDDNFNDKGRSEVSLMGYSMRTIDFRYTAWIHFNRTAMTARWDVPPMEEELYDHRAERPQDFTHLELVNVATRPNYSKIVQRLRHKLLTYLTQNIVFHGPYPK